MSALTSNNNIYLSPDLGCAFRWSEEYGQLEWAPQLVDGSIDWNDGGPVDEEIVGQEVVTFHGSEMTLSEVYRYVENALGVL